MTLWILFLLVTTQAQPLVHEASIFGLTSDSPGSYTLTNRYVNPVIISGSESNSGNVSEVMVSSSLGTIKQGKYPVSLRMQQGAPNNDTTGIHSSHSYFFVAEAGLYQDDYNISNFELRNTQISDFIPSWTQVTFTNPFNVSSSVVIAKISNFTSTNRPYLVVRVTNITATGFMLGVQTQSDNMLPFGPPVTVSWIAGSSGCWFFDGDPIAFNKNLVFQNGRSFTLLCNSFFALAPFWVAAVSTFNNPQPLAMQWNANGSFYLQNSQLADYVVTVGFLADSLTPNNSVITQNEFVHYLGFTYLGVGATGYRLPTTTVPATGSVGSTQNKWAYARYQFQSSYGSSFAFVVTSSAAWNLYSRAGTYPSQLFYDGYQNVPNGTVYKLVVDNPVNGRLYWLGLLATGSGISAYSIIIQPLLPQITDFQPPTSSTAGGARLVISGLYFASDSLVFIGDYPCGNVSVIGTVSIACTIPPGVGQNLLLTVKCLLTRPSGPQFTYASTNFSYSPPTIAFSLPSTIPTLGGNVSLIGTNFGSLGNATATTGTGASIPIYSISSDGTSLLCLLPPGQDSLSVTVVVGGQSADILLAYTAPKIVSVSPQNGDTAGGGLVTLTGTNFGLDASVTVNSENCTRFNQNHTNFICYVPPGQGYHLPVTITVGQQSYTDLLAYSYGAPNISHILPTHGPTAGGYSLTIYGTSFGFEDATVSFGSTTCNVQSQNHTLITCGVPSGAGQAQLVGVQVGGQTSRTVTFSYDPPTISNLSSEPGNGGTQGGGNLTIEGVNFGSSQISATVKVNFLPCPLLSHNDSLLICQLPSGQGTTNEVLLTVEGQVSSTNPPYDDDMSGASNSYASGRGVATTSTTTTTTVSVNTTTTITTITTVTTIVTRTFAHNP